MKASGLVYRTDLWFFLSLFDIGFSEEVELHVFKRLETGAGI